MFYGEGELAEPPLAHLSYGPAVIAMPAESRVFTRKKVIAIVAIFWLFCRFFVIIIFLTLY